MGSSVLVSHYNIKQGCQLIFWHKEGREGPENNYELIFYELKRSKGMQAVAELYQVQLSSK